MTHLRVGSLVLITLFGCYGTSIVVETTPISPGSYPPPNTGVVELYFHDNNLKIDKRYEQICRIEIKGTVGTASSELVDEMRKKAAQIGADAVINIVQTPITREQGNLIADLAKGPNDKPDTYRTASLAGIAIKYK